MRLRRCPETGRLRRRSDGRLYRCDVTPGLHCSHCAPGTTPRYYMMVAEIAEYACPHGCIDRPLGFADLSLEWPVLGGVFLMTQFVSPTCRYQGYTDLVPRTLKHFSSTTGICVGLTSQETIQHYWQLQIAEGLVRVWIIVEALSGDCPLVYDFDPAGTPVAAYGAAPIESPHDCWNLPPIELSIGVGVVTLEPG